MSCNHKHTIRVSSDVPDYYQCENCGKQFDESQITGMEDRNDDSSGDVGRIYE